MLYSDETTGGGATDPIQKVQMTLPYIVSKIVAIYVHYYEIATISAADNYRRTYSV